METTLDFLVEKHKTLKNDYKMPSGKYVEHCGMVACEVAERLISEGKDPYIVAIFSYNKTLIPLFYEGRVMWGAHQVCCEGDLAYDPILKKPVPIKDYCQQLFGQEFPMKIFVPPSKMKEFMKPLKKYKKIKNRF